MKTVFITFSGKLDALAMGEIALLYIMYERRQGSAYERSHNRVLFVNDLMKFISVMPESLDTGYTNLSVKQKPTYFSRGQVHMTLEAMNE